MYAYVDACMYELHQCPGAHCPHNKMKHRDRTRRCERRTPGLQWACEGGPPTSTDDTNDLDDNADDNYENDDNNDGNADDNDKENKEASAICFEIRIPKKKNEELLRKVPSKIHEVIL